MVLKRQMRTVATLLRRFPWIVALARIGWRLRQPKFTAGAVGVIFDDAGRVLLVEHVFHPYAPWGLPGGWVDRREDPRDTVQRELHEELGAAVQVGPVLAVELGFGNHLDMAYLCSLDGGINQISRELLGYAWRSVDDLPKLQSFHLLAIDRALTVTQGKFQQRSS